MYKILIVEDEDIIRKGLMFMVDWLKVNCAVVGEAIDGNDGLEKIKELRPDIVITDVKMPFKNGIQMLEESIEQYGYEAIIISGYSEFEYAKKAITLSVTEYLLKPIDFGHLYQTIEKLTYKMESHKKMDEYMESLSNIQSRSILDIRFFEMQSPKTKYVGKMLDYIKTCYQQKISLTDLSAEYGLSSTYLNTKLKRETQYTFNDLLNRYRVLRAVDLLKRDEMKVYEIAEAVGFQDYKYFIQVFKKYIGFSPIKFLNAQGQCSAKKNEEKCIDIT